jgi:hypothetical protein
VVYHLPQQRDAFKAESAPDYARQRRERELKQLTRHARKLGYTLPPFAAASSLASAG